MGPRWGSIPRLTDWLTVSRNVTLTLTWVKVKSDEPSRQTRTEESDQIRSAVKNPNKSTGVRKTWRKGIRTPNTSHLVIRSGHEPRTRHNMVLHFVGVAQEHRKFRTFAILMEEIPMSLVESYKLWRESVFAILSLNLSGFYILKNIQLKLRVCKWGKLTTIPILKSVVKY
jgi:hypothetical protein